MLMFVNQKAQEISHALILVGAYIRRPELCRRIERLGLQLVEDISFEEWDLALMTSTALGGLINVGRLVFDIESTNAQILIKELSNLNAAIRQIAALGERIAELPNDLPNLEEIFSKPPMIKPPISSQTQNSEFDVTMRQSAILEKIRQSSSKQMQLRELLAVFPDVSERTMRYDLQKLCLRGSVERVGNGGPGSYYVIK